MRGSLANSQKGYVLSSTPEFTAEQLAAARAKAWHQSGEPLLTLDSVRDWLTASGLVLFTPRPLQLPVPAPSLVEAMLGASNVGPTDGQIDAARSIVARLVAEGNALPLNLFGITGDLPDFVVSAQVFSFIYTLRGDKAWKQPPAASSPLGLRVYEVLADKGALSAAELASELGRELTESAIQRSLTELWSNLRVLPLLSQGNGPTLWELTSRRFTKAIKAGINAGQPTALSALISLYLAQSLLATEDEVETFLSPLAARSRIREVLHALTGSRQLETIVLEGKSLMVIPGTLPEFPAIEKPEPTEEELAAAAAASLEGEGRIKRFSSSSERRAFGDFKGKPARTFGTRPPSPRTGIKSDAATRRPFKRDAAASDKPSFTKPWTEDRKPRAEGDSAAPRRPYTPRAASAGSSFAKRPYTPREGGASGSAFPKRPYTPRAEGDSAAPKRPYAPRGASAGSVFPKRPYTPREGASTDRPARPSFGAKRAFGDKPAFRKTPGEGFASKPRFAAKDGERKPFERKPFVRRESAASSERPERPSFGAKRSFDAKPGFAAKSSGDSFSKFRKFDAPKKPFVRRDDTERPAYGGSDSKPRAPKEPKFDSPSGTPKRPFPRKEGDLAGRPVRPWPEAKPGRADGRPGGYGSKPRAPRKTDSGDRPPRPSFGAKRSFGDKPAGNFGSKPGGFSKRPSGPGGKVPFGSKPSFGKRSSSAGGFKPVARKPEE